MTEFSNKILKLSISEWLYFGKQTFDINNNLIIKGHRETEPGFWERVGVFWEYGTGYDLNGLNDDWPWSAAFISYIMKKSGAKNNFFYSIRHSDYINRSINGDTLFFLGRRINEYSPKIGDLVCYYREDGVSYDNLPKQYKSHSDIVTKVTSDYIEVIGGNVVNSVSKKILRVDKNGLLIDENFDWFTIIENKL